MSTAVASGSIDNESSLEVDFEPYVNTVYTSLPSPKELVKKGISLDLIGRAVGMGGLRFTPALRETKEGDGSVGEAEEKVDGEDGNNKGEAEWEDDAEEEDEGEGERELEIAVQMYATMTRLERKEMMDLLEANMKVMYATLLYLYKGLPTKKSIRN